MGAQGHAREQPVEIAQAQAADHHAGELPAGILQTQAERDGGPNPVRTERLADVKALGLPARMDQK